MKHVIAVLLVIVAIIGALLANTIDQLKNTKVDITKFNNDLDRYQMDLETVHMDQKEEYHRSMQYIDLQEQFNAFTHEMGYYWRDAMTEPGKWVKGKDKRITRMFDISVAGGSGLTCCNN